MQFDLVVLGTDPAVIASAMRASQLGQRVAIVDDSENFGKFAAVNFAEESTPAIRYFSGLARFRGTESLEITFSRKTECLAARRYLLACGNRPKRPAHVLFDGQRILDSDEAASLDQVPGSVLIVGAGEHGLRTASRLLCRGLRVSLVDQSHFNVPGKSPWRGRIHWEEIQQARCPVHWGTSVLGVESRHSVVTVYFENGAIESYGGVVFAVGREGCTQQLNLPRPDLLLDETGRIWCGEQGQTGLPNFFAVGSVVGFPRFRGSPTEEARRVLEQIFSEKTFLQAPAFLKMEKRLSPR
jgi:NAD(P) transhydrogenase